MDIVTFLTEEGLVAGDGIDTFRDVAPETPDTLIAVYEYQSGPPAIHEPVAQRSIQILARAKSATTAKAKALEIFNAFSPSAKIMTITDERWCIAYPRQTPFKIKIDSEDRIYYGFNLGITTYTD